MTKKDKTVWAEMARRKVQFHSEKEWDKINLWGLFLWGTVSHLIKKGELLTDMNKENKTVWVKPSEYTWEKYIKPLTENYSLKELTKLAGWEVD